MAVIAVNDNPRSRREGAGSDGGGVADRIGVGDDAREDLGVEGVSRSSLTDGRLEGVDAVTAFSLSGLRCMRFERKPDMRFAARLYERGQDSDKGISKTLMTRLTGSIDRRLDLESGNPDCCVGVGEAVRTLERTDGTSSDWTARGVVGEWLWSTDSRPTGLGWPVGDAGASALSIGGVGCSMDVVRTAPAEALLSTSASFSPSKLTSASSPWALRPSLAVTAATGRM